MAHTSPFAFDWEENRGLDLQLIEWERQVDKGRWDSKVLELSQALYSSFAELRKIRRIMIAESGISHSAWQWRFELFAHNHFLSIATTRVLKILSIGFSDAYEQIKADWGNIIDQVVRYRNAMEHQTEIGMGKNAPHFFNNLNTRGYTSEGNSLPYSKIEGFLNGVMAVLEADVAGERS